MICGHGVSGSARHIAVGAAAGCVNWIKIAAGWASKISLSPYWKGLAELILFSLGQSDAACPPAADHDMAGSLQDNFDSLVFAYCPDRSADRCSCAVNLPLGPAGILEVVSFSCHLFPPYKF